MKSTIKKLGLSLISISLLGSITAPTVPPTNIYAAKTSKNKTITINGKKISRAAFTRKLKHAKVVYHVSKKQVNQILKKKPADASAISTRFAPAIAATAFIPGIGEAALTVGGAIIIGGATIAAGSWLYINVYKNFHHIEAMQDIVHVTNTLSQDPVVVVKRKKEVKNGIQENKHITSKTP